MILKKWEEAIGTLLSVSINEIETSLILQFSSGTLLTIPFSIDLKNRLNNSIGKRIGILHTDLEEKNYLIRIEDLKYARKKS